MKDREVIKFQMFNRVLGFGATYAEYFPSSTFGGERFAVVANAADQLAALAAAQITGNRAARQGAATKAELREELRDDLAALIRTVRSIARQISDIKEKFRMPRSNNDQTLISSARAFSTAAAPYDKELARREMPVDFLAEFDKKIAMFEKAISDQNKGTSMQVGATAAIDGAIERGLEAVKDLDAVVRNKFRDDSTVLAIWASASRIKLAPSASAKQEPIPVPQPK